MFMQVNQQFKELAKMTGDEAHGNLDQKSPFPAEVGVDDTGKHPATGGACVEKDVDVALVQASFSGWHQVRDGDRRKSEEAASADTGDHSANNQVGEVITHPAQETAEEEAHGAEENDRLSAKHVGDFAKQGLERSTR
ncbi:hypothetical protein PMKS-000072 [Pichia membranifaciens]|uniref:Uncharacterized protein n=1 Tax=Pichia membranifaciens TaxID=4926 RepID=A0A1Q2YAX2_9ASCO|nr:hypothetical protein PMKS-000072 [Pichia membranifaciens]